MAHYRSANHHTRARRHSGVQSGPLIAFLLIASFGILFAGCSGPVPDEELEEFSFTAEDVERFREMVQDADEETTATGALAEPSLDASEPPVLDLSMLNTYSAMRAAPSVDGDNLYRVTNAFLNVRAEPRINAAEVHRLFQGDTVTVLDFVDAAWAQVELTNGTKGYVAHRYIAKLTSEDRLAEEKKAFEGQYFVDFGFLNVRKNPSSQSDKIGELPGQALVRPLSVDEVWARVPFDGKEGYVAVQYLSPFLPNFLVRQEHYTLPILHYRLVQEGILDQLVQHISALQQQGYDIITLSDFYNLLLKQEERDVRLDPNTVVLAISDVTPENVGELSDVLRASNVPATLFLQTKHLGISGITDSKIMTLLANGNDIQSGGHTGDDLRSLTNAQVELELAQSRKIIEDKTKKTVFAIGYPRGGVNERVTEKAADAGLLLGVSSSPEITFSRSDFLRMPSVLISSSMTMEKVLEIVRGD